MREQLLVEGSPVRADAHWLAVTQRRLDNGAELAILLFLEADITGIDAVFVQRLGACRMIRQELVADVVKIADNRHVNAELLQALLDVGHRRSRAVTIHGYTDDLRSGARQIGDLA